MNHDNIVANQGEDHLEVYKSKLMVQDTQLKIVELKLESSSLNANHMKTLNQQLQWNLEQVEPNTSDEILMMLKELHDTKLRAGECISDLIKKRDDAMEFVRQVKLDVANKVATVRDLAQLFPKPQGFLKYIQKKKQSQYGNARKCVEMGLDHLEGFLKYQDVCLENKLSK